MAILSLQVSRDMKSIAAGPLRGGVGNMFHGGPKFPARILASFEIRSSPGENASKGPFNTKNGIDTEFAFHTEFTLNTKLLLQAALPINADSLWRTIVTHYGDNIFQEVHFARYLFVVTCVFEELLVCNILLFGTHCYDLQFWHVLMPLLAWAVSSMQTSFITIPYLQSWANHHVALQPASYTLASTLLALAGLLEEHCMLCTKTLVCKCFLLFCFSVARLNAFESWKCECWSVDCAGQIVWEEVIIPLFCNVGVWIVVGALIGKKLSSHDCNVVLWIVLRALGRNCLACF